MAASCANSNNNKGGSQIGIILLGNTGAGKSFLGNILLGRDAFKNECNPNSVTHETEFETFVNDDESYAVFNIPGLIEGDQTAIDRNKREIYKAFEQRPNSVVVFIFVGGSSGRMRDEDLVAFNALHQAFKFKPQSLVLIVNDLPPRRSENYEATVTVSLERLLKISNLKVCFLDRIDNKNHDECNRVRTKLIEFIIGRSTPELHKKEGDIQLHVDTIAKLKVESKAAQEKLENEINSLRDVIADKDREFKAAEEQRQKEFEHLKDEMKRKDQNHSQEIQSMQHRINTLESIPPQVIVKHVKRKHWWKKL
ncbi:unnamed protein product [Adineta ricciae]|uniref:AIG1-type G domain-containing protein n=1 Tax=Adineta ricciae TaxID=249248 RepID=A0A814ERG4_ADIRI|nr:unnamed protein product [Adineta ricciae]CAF1378542.1 unnamed protein product [Adineta ricciae]